MNHHESTDNASADDMRGEPPPLLILTELDPSAVADGLWLHDYYVSGDVSCSGEVREICPNCEGMHLLLVLRQEFVKLPHLYCPRCTRCYDAHHADRTPALSPA